jgi:hypothetical protein
VDGGGGCGSGGDGSSSGDDDNDVKGDSQVKNQSRIRYICKEHCFTKMLLLLQCGKFQVHAQIFCLLW